MQNNSDLKYVRLQVIHPLLYELMRKVHTEEEINFMCNNIDENSELWMCYNDKPVGFIYYYVANSVPVAVQVGGCYIRPGHSNVGKVLMEKVENFARGKNIKYITASVKRSTKGFQRKYGFKVHSTNIIREVK